jgi:hypothetical protein
MAFGGLGGPMWLRSLAAAILLAGTAASPASAAEVPLRVTDPAPRPVLVHFEISSDPASVGQSYDIAFPASWSVSNGVGRVEVSAAAHGDARARLEGLGYAPVPDSFGPLVVEIDLGTLEATSPATSGALTNGTQSLGFDTRALGTTTLAGVISNSPLFCTSQAYVDFLCTIVPSYCGQTCTIVPGAPYDPASGKINLVGSESAQGCDGSICFGPFENFARTGDLRLMETFVPPVPAASAAARVALALLLAAAAASDLARGGSHHGLAVRERMG